MSVVPAEAVARRRSVPIVRSLIALWLRLGVTRVAVDLMGTNTGAIEVWRSANTF